MPPRVRGLYGHEFGLPANPGQADISRPYTSYRRWYIQLLNPRGDRDCRCRYGEADDEQTNGEPAIESLVQPWAERRDRRRNTRNQQARPPAPAAVRVVPDCSDTEGGRERRCDQAEGQPVSMP